jgi:hypothetical protein
MDARLEQFRNEAERVGPGRGRKFPRSLMTLGADYARGRRDAGASWQVIAREMGIVAPTVQRWAKRAGAVPAFHRVALAERVPRGTYAAVLPGGLRIEGLELDAIVVLAKALS